MIKFELAQDAKCLVSRVAPSAFRKARAEGLWALGTLGRERRIWERLYVGDRVVIYDVSEQSFDLLAAEIVGKSLDLSVPKSERPLRLVLKIYGACRTKALPLHGYHRQDDLFCPAGAFSELWVKCEAQSVKAHPKYDEYFYSFRNVRVRVATSLTDLAYIREFAKAHSFGYREAFITLIASDDSGPVGAILAQPCLSTRRPHAATARVFGKDYEHFRHSSLSIKRIFTNEKADHKIEVQEALLRGFLEVAPFLVDEPLRLVDAVSYDPHPLAQKVGFFAELPNRPTDSIYFWRPFNLAGDYVKRRALDPEDTKQAIHELIAARANLKFYGAFGRLQGIGRAIREKAWALEDSSQNRGLWKSLRKGDVLFLIRDKQILEGYGVVASTTNDDTTHYETIR